MDKVKINSVNWKLVNATFTFDDANVPSLTVNLNDMTISDGDILATELNKYGQAYKADCLARIPSQAVAESVGSEFGYVDGVIVPIIPETPPVAPEWDGEPIPGVDDVPPEAPIDPETPIDPEVPEVPETPEVPEENPE